MAKQIFEAKDFTRLLGMPGFSDKLLKNHFKLYEGYVKNANKLSELFDSQKNSKELAGPGLAEPRRRFAWEFNGMRLHEYYFANLDKSPSTIPSTGILAKKISANFGSFKSWSKNFTTLGTMRGIGWVILAYDAESDRLFNTWINEHDLGLLTGSTPLLVMDVFEHAFLTDYGLEKEKYINAFWKAVQWSEVQRRLERNLI